MRCIHVGLRRWQDGTRFHWGVSGAPTVQALAQDRPSRLLSSSVANVSKESRHGVSEETKPALTMPRSVAAVYWVTFKSAPVP